MSMSIFHKASNESSNISSDSIHILQLIRDNLLINHGRDRSGMSKGKLDLDVSLDSSSDNSAKSIKNSDDDDDEEDDDDDDDDSLLSGESPNRKNRHSGVKTLKGSEKFHKVIYQ
jgi:hypothetical protein